MTLPMSTLVIVQSKDSTLSWIPEISKYYSISAIVTDMGGNVISTPIQNVYIENFYAGGLASNPLVSQIFLSNQPNLFSLCRCGLPV